MNTNPCTGYTDTGTAGAERAAANRGAVKVGDRVRVVAPSLSFGDYDAGSEGTVVEVDSLIGTGAVTVEWAERFHDDDADEANRARYLFADEYEILRED